MPLDDFTQQALACIPYFSTTAQVSGGLVGLVFVALTFNTKMLGVKGSPLLRDLARQTFADFLMVLIMSLIMLIPNIPPTSNWCLSLALSLVGAVRIARSLFNVRRDARWLRQSLALQRFGLSLLGHFGVFCAGLAIFTDSNNPSTTWSLLLMSPLLLLISGSRSAWLLVTHDSD